MTTGRFYIGTSGWCYSHWAKGRFYPKGLKQADWLHFFSQHFTTVEVNCSFYRLPHAEMVVRWRKLTGVNFRFAVKLWRHITHEKRLIDCREPLSRFFNAVGEFRIKRGPLLVQLPPSMQKNLDRLETFLNDLKQAAGRTRWKVAVEFRNAQWLDDDVFDLLNRYGAALCLADMEKCPMTEPNEVDFIYIRRHGPGGRYRGCYAKHHLEQDAERIRIWLSVGKDVYIYFNNDVEGYAVDNAKQLRELLTKK